MKKIFIALFLFIGLLQVSCSPETVSNSPTTNPVDVYVAGSKDDQACYWKNGQIVILDSNNLPSTIAKKIIVSNGNVYVLGNGESINKSYSLFWKNGVLTNLSVSFSIGVSIVESITDMEVIDNDVYFVGYKTSSGTVYIKQLTYWKNNIPTTIKNYLGGFNNNPKIKVVNNDVYITAASEISSNPFYRIDGFYKNGVFNQIQNSIIYSFTKNNNDVYVTGYKLITEAEGFYKNISNNSETTIPSCSKISFLIFDNNKTYYSDTEKIYKNGNLIYQIPIGSNNVFDLKIKDDIIYKIAGSQINNINPILQINDTTVMTGSLNEVFNSLFIVQN